MAARYPPSKAIETFYRAAHSVGRGELPKEIQGGGFVNLGPVTEVRKKTLTVMGEHQSWEMSGRKERGR